VVRSVGLVTARGTSMTAACRDACTFDALDRCDDRYNVLDPVACHEIHGLARVEFPASKGRRDMSVNLYLHIPGCTGVIQLAVVAKIQG